MKNRLITRRNFIAKTATAAAALGSAPLLSGLGCGVRRQANIIFLLTDDQRWDTMGCMGNSIIHTPHMDDLAENGCLFENAFVTTSICMSSRASILTGQYLRRHGINNFSQSLSDDAMNQTYPVLLRKAGYRTGFIGKYGIGNQLPEQYFDVFDGFAGQGKYFPDEYGGTTHLTKIIGDKAITFLQGCSGKQPFCLSVSFKAPHVQDEDPRQFLYDPAYEDLYKDVTIPLPHTATPEYFDRLPDFLKNSEARRRWQMRFSTPEKYQQSVKGYYRLISGVDAVIGRIRDKLSEMGAEDNTIIILMGDNGFYLGEHGLAGKWFMHEESIRVPLLIYHPGLSASKRGQKRSDMVLNVDIAPTVLELAGVSPAPNMQGKSLAPLLMGENPSWRNDFYYEHRFNHQAIPKSEGVRTERWKYIRYIEQKPAYEELYDLRDDPFEEVNLARLPRYTKVLRQMRDRWKVMRRELK